MGELGTCPVCQGKCELLPELRQGDLEEFDCQRCGRFGMSPSALSEYQTRGTKNRHLAKILCHTIRKMQRPDSRPKIDSTLVIRVDMSGRLPTPTEQVENLLLWVGDHISAYGESIRIQDDTHGGIVGTAGPENLAWLVKHVLDEGLLEGKMFLVS